jgi:predicted DNA-binding transcriptional regulator YafY
MSDPTARTLRLLTLLQTHRFWPGAELAEQLEVSQRTVRRDVDRLRELGYPVDATPGAAGGYRLAAGAHMPPLLLDDDEAVAIALGLRAATRAGVEGIEDTSLRALAKLEQVLPDRLRRRVRSVHSNVAVLRWRGDDSAIDPEYLAVLTQACRDREEVRFDYRRRDGTESRRLVQPHQLVSAGRRWYLVAWDVRRDDWRTFRVDRLDAPQLAGRRFPPRELPAEDAAAFVAAALQSTPVAHQVDVVVRGDAGEIAAVARWLGAEVEAVDLDVCRVRLRGDSIEWLAWMVALLAVHSEIEIGPEGQQELVEAVGLLAARLAVASVATNGVVTV